MHSRFRSPFFYHLRVLCSAFHLLFSCLQCSYLTIFIFISFFFDFVPTLDCERKNMSRLKIPTYIDRIDRKNSHLWYYSNAVVSLSITATANTSQALDISNYNKLVILHIPKMPYFVPLFYIIQQVQVLFKLLNHFFLLYSYTFLNLVIRWCCF